MAYIAGTSEYAAVGATSISPLFIVPAHKEGDLLVCFLCAKAFGTPFPISATDPSWTAVTSPTLGANNHSVSCWYKIAQSSNESPVSFSGGGINTGYWSGVIFAIREHFAASPIDAFQVTDHVNAANTVPSGGITTTTNNALVLTAFGTAPAGTVYPFEPAKTNLAAYARSTTSPSSCSVGVVRSNKYTAGEVASKNFGVMSPSNNTGQSMVVAIRDAGNGKLPAELSGGVTPLLHLGGNLTWDGITTLSSPTTILTALDGVQVMSPVSTVSGQPVMTVLNGYVRLQSVNQSSIDATGRWWGGSFTLSAPTSLGGKIVGIIFNTSNNTSPPTGAKAWAIVFSDSQNNWVAFNFAPLSDYDVGAFFARYFDIDTEPRYGQSAQQINWADVTKVTILHHRITTTTGTSQFHIKALFTFEDITLTGGCKESPASFSCVSSLFSPWFNKLYGADQMGTQVVFPASITLGNSLDKTHIDTSGEAFSFYRKGFEGSFRNFWKLPANKVAIKIKTTANDTVKLASSICATQTEQKFIIDASCSQSALYDFSGLSLSGFRVEHQAAGITMNGVKFQSSYVVLSGNLYACLFEGGISSPFVISGNLSNIQRCNFTKNADGGHAIEITQPGTFSFVGNTFNGYGLDGTTDAAIYNNSGGHVVLNVSGGGDTPTVRNGAGATTEVVSGAQITVVGLAAGSQVKVTKVSNGDVLFNGTESGGQISFSTTYIGAVRVEARKASASPFYRPWATQATTISGQTVEVTALQELDE